MNDSLVRLRVARAMREDRGRFAAVRDARVLVYWPHGLGDWTHLGAIGALLEPSNRYAVVRFGDDYSSIMEGNPHFTPLSSGVRVPCYGGEFGRGTSRSFAAQTGRKRRGSGAPAAAGRRRAGVCSRRAALDRLSGDRRRDRLSVSHQGSQLARLLVRKERLASFDLSQPLRNAIDFSAPAQTQQRLDERLAAFAPPGTRLGVLSRAGITAARKNWGDGSEARSFVETMRHDDPRWRFISMDDEKPGDGVAGFRALFAGLDEPFARLYKALAARTGLFVGVPAGPLHVTMARGGIPVVGLWLAHHPDWYDEPNSSALHLVGRHVRDRGFDRRAATATKPASLQHRLEYLETLGIPADVVVEAARATVR